MILLRKVTRTYRRGHSIVPALRGLYLSIEAGGFVTIMGPSGSGKSTLMHLLGGLDRPDEGEVLLDGQDVGQLSDDRLAELRGRLLGFVFQGFNLLSTLSALENVELPMIFQRVDRGQRRDRAQRLLQQVGLEERTDHKPAELSGGEQQRVAVARALANDPQILLADEPTGNLDSESGGQIMDLLAWLNDERDATVVVVTHDPDVARYADWIIRLKDGQPVESGTEEGESAWFATT